MSSAERNRRWRARRGRGRARDIAYVVLLPVTNADVDDLDRLHLLPEGRRDKDAVTEAVREMWVRLEVGKNL